MGCGPGVCGDVRSPPPNLRMWGPKVPPHPWSKPHLFVSSPGTPSRSWDPSHLILNFHVFLFLLIFCDLSHTSPIFNVLDVRGTLQNGCGEVGGFAPPPHHHIFQGSPGRPELPGAGKKFKLLFTLPSQPLLRVSCWHKATHRASMHATAIPRKRRAEAGPCRSTALIKELTKTEHCTIHDGDVFEAARA